MAGSWPTDVRSRTLVSSGAMDPSDWVARDASVVWHGFTQMASFADHAPVIVDTAAGHEVVDVDGTRYLDAISSLWVTTLGHRVPELDDALRAQLERGAHTTMLGNGNRVVIELAEALATVVPVDEPHFLFASDGASAVEQALKIAFQYWVNRGVAGRTQFLAFAGAYHGDTLGALSVGDDRGFGAETFAPLRFPVLRAPAFSDPRGFDVAVAMVEAHRHELAAVIVEPLVQGAAGMQTAPPEAFAALGAACRDHDVLLICDEVATGFGRTGTLFASEQCRLRPDLLCLGKGLTGGYLPMSATVAAGHVFDAFLGEELGPRTLYHGHSYGGNALAAAVALRHLELLHERDVLTNVRARSVELRRLLDERVVPHRAVAAVRLHGLMGGVELAAPDPAARWGRRVCAAAVRRGVLLRPLGDVVVLMPPLTVTSAELRQIVDTLVAALDDVVAEPRASELTRTGGSIPQPSGERERVHAAGRWREPRDLDAAGPEGKLAPDGRAVVSFASNDYLGLTQHPDVIAASHRAIDRWGTGAGSARLIVGSRPVHGELETALADWKNSERAVLFTTGYAANLGVLTTFGGADTLICSDALNHASIIDGCRLARGEVAVYRHCDVDHLRSILRGVPGRSSIVVTDTVFSMDGDVAPVDDLVELCATTGALLVLDEAHAVLGPDPDLHGVEALRVGTLSKTLGALGGFVAGPAALVELVVNRARAYIFTTASTPGDAAAALAALRVLQSGEGAELVQRLRGYVARVRPGHRSPIVPVILGDERAALEASARLLDDGIYVPAIRPPTVAPGTARLRVTLSAAHTSQQVEQLAQAIARVARV